MNPLAALSVKAEKQNHHRVLQQKDLNWDLLPKVLEELKGQMETTRGATELGVASHGARAWFSCLDVTGVLQD